jgi:hypothetical protein
MRRHLEIGAILVVLALFFTFLGPSLTGYAVKQPVNTNQIQVNVLKLATTSELIVQSKPGSRFCIIVPTESGTESFNIDRDSSIKVKKSTNLLCDGQTNEDFIIKYLSAEYFLEDSKNPAGAKTGHGGKKFYFLPSKYIELGGNVICNLDFQNSYCDSLPNIFSTEELILSDSSCCIKDDLNSMQKKLLLEHYKDSRYTAEDEKTKEILEKKPIFQMPSATNGFLLILLVCVVIGALVVVYVFHSKDEAQPNEAERYLISGLKKGYKIEQLVSALVQNGWEEDELEHLISKVRKDREAY